MKEKIPALNIAVVFVLIQVFFPVNGQFVTKAHRNPAPGEIPVTSAGSYDKPGATYILVNDIKSPKSAIFLGKDVILDLNGYTVYYADGNYDHIKNGSFEEGLKGWNVTKAPSATTKDQKVHVFVGDSILSLKAGEEIASEYITLPLPDRSYIAFCGVIGPDMKVSVYVDDLSGKSIECVTEYHDTTMVSCPVENRSPRLGGGFIFAHLNKLPAGKYRIRVKAVTDCLIDYIDIRPAMDAGIGIVENTHAMGHNDHLYERAHSAFFDYTADVRKGEPVAGIPRVTGKGTVTIRNGQIRNGGPGILSWGVQSTAADVTVILENVSITTSGINSIAVDVPQAVIINCSFNVDNPFIINRHGSEFYAVDLTGDMPSEVSFSEFHGGQGCLSFKGNYSKIHHNYLVNRQTVTNHYSIMAMGDSSLIFNNRIEPEIGSGIEVYVHRGMEIFNNTISITAAPPTCEYGHEEYSTTAIRIADYNAAPGSSDGCFGNKVYGNRINVTGRDYPEFTDYIPMAWAVFYSASAGDNYVFGNEIVINDLNIGLKNETSGFYIGGGTIGGKFYGNRITSNVPVAWVGNPYGAAKDTRISDNLIIRSADAPSSFKAFRIGWTGYKGSVAENVCFESNVLDGFSFDTEETDQLHKYKVIWTLGINVLDKSGNPSHDIPVTITDKNGKEILKRVLPADGRMEVKLPEYSSIAGKRDYSSPYIVRVGKRKSEVTLDKNREIAIKL
jgi:hypothetical protein